MSKEKKKRKKLLDFSERSFLLIFCSFLLFYFLHSRSCPPETSSSTNITKRILCRCFGVISTRFYVPLLCRKVSSSRRIGHWRRIRMSIRILTAFSFLMVFPSRGIAHRNRGRTGHLLFCRSLFMDA